MPPNTHPISTHAVGEESALLLNNRHDGSSKTKASMTLGSLFQKPSEAPKKAPYADMEEATYSSQQQQPKDNNDSHCQQQFAACVNEPLISTVSGSFTFLLYHVVYCLAQASTITRPHADHSSVGTMARIAALGTVFAGPVFVWELGLDVPAIYPASDLFLSPFLAQVAADIDHSLYDHGLENNDRIFLATFGALIGAGFLASGLLCILAARVKLANLGSFLPYCVLCGFFTTIGLLIWSLGFSVDTGMKVGELFSSYHDTNDGKTWLADFGKALMHHAPSLTIGVFMHIVGQKNSFYVIALVVATILGSYAMLWATGTSLERAQELNWFFSSKELQEPPFLSSSPNDNDQSSWWESWTSPAPMGVMVMLFHGDVHWPSFQAGLSTMSALAFLYLIRCSLHSAALKKNIPNVTRNQIEPSSPTTDRFSFRQSFRRHHQSSSSSSRHAAKRDPISLGKILECGYGYSQLVAAFTGGITVAPAVAASLTLFKLGCEGVAPQYGSFLLVLVFYLTNFQLVQYIPKPAVSCLMVLAGLDMCKTWLVDSYFKTKAKAEWLVAPLIVVLAFTVGMLNAIFLGIAFSTFIFVANFYKAGTVKFVGNGLTLRSTVERGVPEANWLNQNGDLINILVLSNYIFFGNGQSVFNYIATMFEDPYGPDDRETAERQQISEQLLPPVPKYVIVDFTLVTGMDTSAIDIIREILVLCRGHGCRLFLSGLSPALRSMLVYAKVTPTQEKRTLLFAPDLESALAKAEDGLVNRVFPFGKQDVSDSHNMHDDEQMSDPEEGFLCALQQIDAQHSLETMEELHELSQYTTPVDLGAHAILPGENEIHHGLFFIESGHLRIEHSTDYTTNRTFPLRRPAAASAASPRVFNPLSNTTIGHLNARTGTIGRQTAMLKNERNEIQEQSFRLARVGPGWVVGMIENCSGMRRSGVYVAATPCRLHHLPYQSMKDIEKSNPNLMMKLYKLMSHLSTKRQEMTIGQLAQFVSIMQSPSPTEPTSRGTSVIRAS